MKRAPAASLVNTRVHYWPGLIDMLTSMLMFFLLVYFVESNFGSASAQLAIARQKQALFVSVLHQEFAAEIAAGQVADSADLNLLQIRFGDGVLFEPGSYRLHPRGAALLRRLRDVFHRVDGRGAGLLYEQVQIEGHTDDLPFRRPAYPRDNWELSTARATAVMRFLTRGARPLEERRMSVNGYAQNRPVSERRSRNRRIELRIYFSGRLPAARGAP
ncbi:MAG TPA: OmpA family protein [Longimicrobium sp.]|jgi:outer membrane protein OmpA-like peptidoglycan-associated protein